MYVQTAVGESFLQNTPPEVCCLLIASCINILCHILRMTPSTNSSNYSTTTPAAAAVPVRRCGAPGACRRCRPRVGCAQTRTAPSAVPSSGAVPFVSDCPAGAGPVRARPRPRQRTAMPDLERAAWFGCSRDSRTCSTRRPRGNCFRIR